MRLVPSTRLRLAATGLAALAVMATTPASAQITVTSTSDAAADDGQCTLREAIVASNTDTASGATPGECGAGAGADTITFTVAPGSVIALTADLPRAVEALTIEGPTGLAGGVVVDGGGLFRLFELDSNNLQQTFTLRGLTIRRGFSSAGGGILVGYQDSCVFEHLAVVNNLSTNGAGGIWMGDEGTCSMDHVLVQDNLAEGPSGAGGVRVSSGTTATITNSTIAGNMAPLGTGGGILVGGFSVPTSLTLVQSTVSGNTALQGGGGVIAIGSFATSVVRACTIVRNHVTDPSAAGGGVSFSGVVTFESSIIAENTAVRGEEWNDLSLGFETTSLGGNVIGINGFFTSDFPTGAPNANGDLVGTAAAPLDPLLDSLNDNGGPYLTHLPSPGSPVLDAGRCAGLTTDQRGAPREVDEPGAPNAGGDACDSGATEGTAFFVARDAAPTAGLRLDAPFPSPTHGASRLRFAVDAPGHVRLSVYDALGRRVAVLVDREVAAGAHVATLDAARLATGVYVVRLDAAGVTRTRRLTVVR